MGKTNQLQIASFIFAVIFGSITIGAESLLAAENESEKTVEERRETLEILNLTDTEITNFLHLPEGVDFQIGNVLHFYREVEESVSKIDIIKTGDPKLYNRHCGAKRDLDRSTLKLQRSFVPISLLVARSKKKMSNWEVKKWESWAGDLLHKASIKLPSIEEACKESGIANPTLLPDQ